MPVTKASLDIEAGSSLEDIRKAVNSSQDNFGVTADIINTGDQARLVFRSNVSGEGNDLTVTNDNAEFDAISTQANGGGAGGMAIADADKATDAIIEIDGIQARNDTNTFEDVIQGSTITAIKKVKMQRQLHSLLHAMKMVLKSQLMRL